MRVFVLLVSLMTGTIAGGGESVTFAASAAVAPVITLAPTCGPADGNPGVNVQGSDFPPPYFTKLYITVDYASVTTILLTGPTFDASIDVLALGPGEHTIGAHMGDPTDPPVATASYTVPCPSPTVTIDPTCGPAGQLTTIRVHGEHFLANWDVGLTFNGIDQPGWSTNDGGVFDATINAPPLPDGSYEIVATTIFFPPQPVPRDPLILADNEFYTIPCAAPPPPEPPPRLSPTLSINPACGAGDGASTIQLRGTRYPAGVIVDITFAGGFVSGVRTRSSGSFTTTITTPPTPPGTYELAASGGDPVARATTLFVVPCPGEPPPETPTNPPTLICEPDLGPPGYVTTAIGSNFPAGTTIELRWSHPGFRNALTVVVQPDGTFRVPMLVMARDQLGGRLLEARGSDGVTVLASDGFLVVPGQAAPGGSNREIVFR